MCKYAVFIRLAALGLLKRKAQTSVLCVFEVETYLAPFEASEGEMLYDGDIRACIASEGGGRGGFRRLRSGQSRFQVLLNLIAVSSCRPPFNEALADLY